MSPPCVTLISSCLFRSKPSSSMMVIVIFALLSGECQDQHAHRYQGDILFSGGKLRKRLFRPMLCWLPGLPA